MLNVCQRDNFVPHLVYEPNIVTFQYARAYLVLSEVSRLQEKNSLPCLLAARICYENLDLPEKGLRMAEKALERELAHPQNLLARCHVAIGLGYEMMSTMARMQAMRQDLRKKAFDSFSKYVLMKCSAATFQIEKKKMFCVFSFWVYGFSKELNSENSLKIRFCSCFFNS